ncbi:MAG: hypothetical protein IKE76_04140 [Clostridia bacterium]|nr:hypothetical protein [Clostridia bacterium]
MTSAVQTCGICPAHTCVLPLCPSLLSPHRAIPQCAGALSLQCPAMISATALMALIVVGRCGS